MKVQQVAFNFTAANQVSPWLALDYWEHPFNAGLLVSLDTGFAGDLSIQYILDAFLNDTLRQVVVSQAANTITVQDSGPPLPVPFGGGLGHGLAVGDYVQLTNTPGGAADEGYAVASVPSAVSYTLTSAVSQTLNGISSARAGRIMTAGAAGDKLIGASGASIAARLALALNAPVWGVRLLATTVTTAGVCRLVSMQGGK